MSMNKKSEAAEKVAKAEKVKKAKPAKANKAGKPNLFARIAHFFKDFKGETKKIVWPGPKEILKNTGVVILAVLVIGAGIWLADWLLTLAVDGVMALAEKYGKDADKAAAFIGNLPVLKNFLFF